MLSGSDQHVTAAEHSTAGASAGLVQIVPATTRSYLGNIGSLFACAERCGGK